VVIGLKDQLVFICHFDQRCGVVVSIVVPLKSQLTIPAATFGPEV